MNPIANVTASEGWNVVLRCNASGIPPPKLTWKKRGSRDILSNDENFLLSKNISRSETGWYQCIATNGFDNPASQQVYINVYCKLLCDQSARDLCVTSVDRRPRFLCLVNINFIFLPDKIVKERITSYNLWILLRKIEIYLIGRKCHLHGLFRC